MTIEETQTPAGENEAQVAANATVASDAQTAVAEVAAETPVAAAPEPEAAPTETVNVADDVDLFEQYMSALDNSSAPDASSDSSYKRLSKGDRIEATVIQVEPRRLFVNLGTKAEGIVPETEINDTSLYQPGDKISVVVIKPEGGNEPAIVSRKRAEFEEQWDKVVQSFAEQSSITAPVVDRVKGGLVVDVGVRGFVPATHVGNGKLRNLDKYVGQSLDLKVIEIDKERKKVVLSNRQAEEERKTEARDEIFKNVQVGAELEGTVRRLTPYGAFVDLGGVDGLLHISEMSWARISHPKEMFKEGQTIKVMVLRLDPGAGKISLGHRQVLPDPWNLIRQNYKIGQKMNVVIGRIVTGGAFVKLEEGAEAFLPISEMSYRRLKSPQEVVEEGQEVEVQVIDLRADDRRMVLSMRALGGGGEVRPAGSSSFGGEFRKPHGKGGRGRSDQDDAPRRGVATSGATIGERLGMLKGLKLSDDETTGGE